MFAISSKTETSNASKYLQQLCKHFAHKVPSTYDTSKGEVDFPFGKCLMTASDSELMIHCQSREQAQLDRTRIVVDDHLLRFAWRENLSIDWIKVEPVATQV